MINYYDEELEKLNREKKENFIFHIFALSLSILFLIIAILSFKFGEHHVSVFFWFFCGVFSAYDTNFFIEYQRTKLKIHEIIWGDKYD